MSTISQPQPVGQRLPEIQRLLESLGQSHVLQYWDQLPPNQQNALVQQIENIDWSELQTFQPTPQAAQHWESLAAQAEPPQALSLAEFFDPANYQLAHQRGAVALAANQCALVLTAGGQGTRLGFDHPKGMFPIGPLSGRSLFQIMFEHCQARAKQFHTAIPIYVMTSPQTHQETDSFLRRHNFFGYPKDDVRLFCQGEMPALDCQTGKILMADRGTIATSPDGHGGALRALDRSGCLADMQRRGVAYVFYGQIDNPLLQICDPAFIGFHILHHSQMTSQVIRKTEPLQRVGNVVQIQGRAQIIEYSDLPDAAAQQRNSDGSLRLWAGSIAVHVFDREFLTRAVQHPEWLPFHRALKKVPAIDGQGNCQVPTHNNAIKLERFIFDLMPHAEQALACEIDPAHGFAALKNAPPAATETATWVQQAISNHFRDWLTRAGCTMAEGATFEINPLFAVDVEELKQRLRPGQHFERSTYLI